MAGGLVYVVPNQSSRSSVTTIYSPASILETSLAGTGGNPVPMVAQFSRAGECVISEVHWPRILNPWTEPAGERLSSFVGNGKKGGVCSYGAYSISMQGAPKT